jgi:aminoglycoside phosphotransferase (APT) family kinase protein
VAAADTPDAEVDIDVALVRRLLEDQHPDLAGLALRPLAHGWDNELFRLGDDLTVRLPRRAAAADLVVNEQRWLPELAPKLPLPVPVPLRVGRPALGYPWAWSVCPWLAGRPAAGADVDPLSAASAMGGFLAALHVPAPRVVPANPMRGVPLAARHDRLLAAVAQLGSDIDGAAVRACWSDALATPPWPGPPLWLHGDLHPLNIVVSDRPSGRSEVTAVIDFGDLTAGDPATDLALGWTMFDPPARERFLTLATAGVDAADREATWARARGWALALSVAYLAGSADNPPLRTIGERGLAAALSG